MSDDDDSGEIINIRLNFHEEVSESVILVRTIIEREGAVALERLRDLLGADSLEETLRRALPLYGYTEKDGVIQRLRCNNYACSGFDKTVLVQMDGGDRFYCPDCLH